MTAFIRFIPIVLFLFSPLLLKAQQKVDQAKIAPKMQWFADAKLGIFIHSGIYAVQGVGESWSFHNRQMSHADYMRQIEGFTLKKYRPDDWARLIRKTGARYAVITTKHHDGVAMYDTRMNDLSIVKSSPARRDMIKPLFEALRKEGIKTGAYYSLIDWTDANYPGFLRDSNRYRINEDYERWQKFRNFFQGQIQELATHYRPDLWWFDGDWEHNAEEWEAQKIRHIILKSNPDAIINGRLQGYGDYETPEQNFPVTRPAYPWWELCMTSNESWGYQPKDTFWKTPYEIISLFVDVVAHGGNLLLDMGPRADGTIPEEQLHLFEELGNWNKRNGDGIFNTRAGMPEGHFYGPSTLSKDSSTLYLFLHGGGSGQVMIKGLVNRIENITVLGTLKNISHKVVGKVSWSKVPGIVYVPVPADALDPYITVLKLKLDGPLRLYRGKGGLF